MPRILRGPGISAERFSLADFEERARDILAAAEERAARIVSEARSEAESIRAATRNEGLAEGREQGRMAGLEEGRAAGREEALAQLRTEGAATLASLEEVLRELESRRIELIRSAEEEVLRFSVAVAEKVVLHEVERLPMEVIALARKGVRLAGAKGDIIVQMNPEDLEILGELAGELQTLVGPEGRVELAADPAMARGSCRVRSSGTEVDLGLETQLERIRSALLGDL